MEDRARAAGVRVRLQAQLSELEKQFYGSSMAYDKAVAAAASGSGVGEDLGQARPCCCLAVALICWRLLPCCPAA